VSRRSSSGPTEREPLGRLEEPAGERGADDRAYRTRLASSPLLALPGLRERCAGKIGEDSPKAQQFKLYRNGQTVAEYLAASKKLSWLRRDVRYGHISVTSK
jgi:hypothetical protein